MLKSRQCRLLLLSKVYLSERDTEQIDDQSPCDPDAVKCSDDSQVLEKVSVGPDENQYPDPGSYKKAGHHLSCRKKVFKIKLRDHYRSSTIRYQSNESGNQHSQNRNAGHDRRESILPDEAYKKADDERDQKNERSYLDGVDCCRMHDTAFFILAAALILFTQIVYVLICPESIINDLHGYVYSEAGDHGYDEFCKQDPDYCPGTDCGREENRYHLI